jgi:hypothetical protein
MSGNTIPSAALILCPQYTTVFQAEAYAIQPCAVENIERGYWRRNIYVLSNSQAAVKALENCKIIESLSGTATSP